MTFSGRIRLYLIAAAVVPSLLVMTVIYFHFERQTGLADSWRMTESQNKYKRFNSIFQKNFLDEIDQLKQSTEFEKALVRIQSGRGGRLDTDPRLFGLDFLEIVDSANTVLATYHRPGLLGQEVDIPERQFWEDSADALEQVVYDLHGAHAAFVRCVPVRNNIAIYTGKYIDEPLVEQLALIVDASVRVFIPPRSFADPVLDTGETYPEEGIGTLVLDGSKGAGFHVSAIFPLQSSRSTYITLFGITGFVAFIAALIAITLGFYITGRAKREIENLVSATSRVAGGDFSTPVMAYDEGEFSQLADSFSDMMHDLRQTQKRLATTEKIAAWQTVGRKIAHEIKNPLTPIAISVDDLRRSHAEKLPQFDNILDETTKTIKSEVERLIKLLDEFVSFARMKAPEIRPADFSQFITDIQTLYRNEIQSGRITVSNKSRRDTINIDPEVFKQVLINLIKNGLEATEDCTVSVTVVDIDKSIEITIEDSGPGFSEDKLSNSFEPYVTTKEGGSGLGLVICHRIVNDHGGTMELYNHSGGAGVRVRLPQ